MRPRSLALVAALIATASIACDTPTSVRLSAFGRPIDFSHACEGDGATVAPVIDESAADFNAVRVCPDLPSGRQGALFGLVVNRIPASVSVVQLNPAAGTRRILDADFFIPGATGFGLDGDPVRIVRAPDWGAFAVVAAGSDVLTHIVLHGLDGDSLNATRTAVALPGAPTDAVVVGDTLVIAARDRAELWTTPWTSNDWSTTTPVFARIEVPDEALELHALDDGLMIVWRNRPWLSRVGLDGAVRETVALVPACRDGLDNDGDGEVDGRDADCLDREDDDESDTSGAARGAIPTPVKGAFDGAPACDNGVDDDGDGLTDLADPTCASADADTEQRPACDNGVDDDGDGAVDTADGDCFDREGRSEGPAAVDGPFSATFVDGGSYGRFVYVLDARLGEIMVFKLGEAGLERVDVHASDAFPPDLVTVPYGQPTAEPATNEALPAVRQPAALANRRRNILIPSGNPYRLANSRVRGELWERLIAGGEVALGAGAELWKPGVCDPESPDGRCVQPANDDASWIVFGAAIDGRIQLFEAIRRGEPMHRLLQRQPDPARRTQDISAPRLTLRGRLINARGQPSPRWPFLGPAAQEVLAEAVANASPQRLRRYGIWPADDFEEAPTEAWTVTYEGALPKAGGFHGRFIDEGTFFDGAQAFCEHGVQVGDWLQLEVPVASVDPVVVQTAVPTLADGRECPVMPLKTALVEMQVTRVGMFDLGLDTSAYRTRPQSPVLDTDAVRAAGLQVRLCQQALTALEDALQQPSKLNVGDNFDVGMVPARVRYRVRPNAAWTAVGSVSGYLHRNRWNRNEGVCTVDETLDARIRGRIVEVPDAVARYDQCPPSNEALAFDRVDALRGDHPRFSNPSFGLDLFTGCAVGETGEITAIPTQQETTFTFNVTGPQAGSALSVSDSMLQARVPLIESRRHQVQLDAGRSRLSVLQLRFGDLKEIITLE
jgi:hypothetical protein